MDYRKGRQFYEETKAIHNLMLNFEFMNKKCLKLGRVECNMLHFLLRERHPVNMRDIAEYMNVSHSRVTHLMDSLIKKNYIIRIPGIDDRRVYYAEITPAGEEIAGKYTDKNIKMFDNFLKNIPKEDVEPIYEALTQWQEFLVKMNTK